MEIKKDKILFWLEGHLAHIGIIKALTDDYDCKPYALISCSPKQKKFFDHQKLINFEKMWFLRDHVDLKKKNHNFEKLEFFEKKYPMLLQKIIYGDRSFYKYNKYYEFSDKEIYSILEQEIDLYDKILDEIKPDFVVMRTPEFQDIELLCEMCKAKKIQVLLLSSARIGSRYTITSNPNSPILFDKLNTKIQIKKINDLKIHVDAFAQEHKKFLIAAQIKKPNIIKLLKLIFSTYNSSNINFYRDLGKTPWNVIKNGFLDSINNYFRKSFLDKNTQKFINNEKHYVYFPLHMEPERSLLRKGEYYTNQIDLIKNISQSLPIGMKLLVKEHPSMKLQGWRNINYYKKIIAMPNVKLMHNSLSSYDLIQNSSLVITIASTVSLESAFFNKCSIVFSDVDCSSLSSVFIINKLENLSEIIKKALNSKVDLIELNQFMDALMKSSFNTDFSIINNIMAKKFGYGFLSGNEILEHQMKIFLEEYKNSFQIIANKHIEKIKYIKQNGTISN